MAQTTILCIDDEQTGLLIRKMMLEAEGYRVLTALTGQQGLAAMASSQVDAVILDYQMPQMNGAEVARQIRQQWPNVPIVLLSGYPEDVPDGALDLVNAFVTKGGAPDQLLLTIAATVKPQPAGRLTILNVNDNPQHRYAVTRVLKQAGYNVVEGRTGREALTLASSRPNLIILDVNLPDMLGFEVCRILKDNPVTRQIPVIHISATYPMGVAHSESKDSGAVRFVEHPQNIQDMVDLVRRELQIAEAG